MIARLFRRNGRPRALLTEYQRPETPVSDLAAAAVAITEVLIFLGFVGMVGAGIFIALLVFSPDAAMFIFGIAIAAAVAFCAWSELRP